LADSITTSSDEDTEGRPIGRARIAATNSLIDGNYFPYTKEILSLNRRNILLSQELNLEETMGPSAKKETLLAVVSEKQQPMRSE
jgi:Cft2 family RNA processing exonuclease